MDELGVLREIAEAAGAVWTGAEWVGLTPGVVETLRQQAELLGLAPEGEAEAQDPDPDFIELVEARERARLVDARERVNRAYRQVLTRPEARGLVRRHAEAVASAVELGLPLTAETVDWLARHPTLDVELGVDAHVDPRLVRAASSVAMAEARAAVLAERRQAVLAGAAFDAAGTAGRLGLDVAEVEEIVAALGPEVHIRAELKRRLADLWRWRKAGRFPEEPPGDRWARLAWLAFAALALPPVFTDRRRWEAKKALEQELTGVGLTVGQLAATVRTARTASQ